MKLSDYCEDIVDCEHKTAPIQQEGYPSIRTPNIGRGYFILEGVNRVSEETYRAWTKRAMPQPGDLIMAREAPVGNVAMIPPGLRPCLGQRTLLIRPNHAKIDARYLTYLLLGPQVQAKIHAQTNGSTVPHLNMRDVRNLELPELPPRQSQRRIAGVLSAYDDLIENCERRIRLLDEMARALYREWFVLFRYPGHEEVPLGSIPTDWRSGRLEDLIVLQRGFDLPKAERQDGDIPIIAATGINGTHSIAKVRAPGVVTGRSGSIGDVLYIQEDFWPLNTTLWGKEFPQGEPLVAYFVLSSIDLKQYNSGAAVPTLNRNDIHGLPVVLPPRSLQRRFQAIAGDLFAERRLLEQKVDNLRQTRDILLPRLLSGQLSVEDAE